MTFEILLDQPDFERITLPFVKNLERLGVTAHLRTVDTAQYQHRLEDFDFDMTVKVWAESLSPGNEQRDDWTSEAARTPGSQNLAGIRDPVVDRLVDLVVAAPDRSSLVARSRALDRVLLWGFYVIPIGTSRPSAWPIGTSSGGRGSRRSTRSASPTRGGSTRRGKPRCSVGGGRAEVSRPRPSPARMLAYVARRLLFMIPTLFGIMVINFAIIQAAPGGPVEQMIARIKGTAVEATARFGGSAGGETGGSARPRGARVPTS